MQVKFLKSLVETLVNKQAVPIIDLLIGKKHVNEFLIAKKLKLTINQTRNILYKLSDYGLVSFIRKKDKRKGWYIYFWTLNIYQSLNLLEQNLEKELEQLESQLKNRKEKRYYLCKTCSIEVAEETALINDFVCPECEQVYELSQNQDTITDLEKNIAKLKKEMEFVISERKIEGEKLEKKKDIKIKKAETKKKEERMKKREIRKKEKMDEIKKSGKKAPSPKPAKSKPKSKKKKI
ncbi:Transcription factor E [uncultured archaeon]|nr:Transcription factor E [uncultured archaeon]